MIVPLYLSANQPLRFSANLSAKNRLYFASMGLDLCDEHGIPKPEFIRLYESLMDGGSGFGFLGNASVDADSSYNEHGLKLITPGHAQALRPLFDAARQRHFPLGIQLQHYGPQGVPDSKGEVLSPSGIPSQSTLRKYPDVKTLTMTQQQIQTCIEQFAAAAKLAQLAGARMLQLQASNGYLLSSFLSPRTNLRSDEWGGTPLKRARLLLEVVRAVRQATAGQMPVTVRLGIDDGYGAEGQQVSYLGEVAAALEEAGAASITCSIGISETFRHFFSDQEKTVRISRTGCRYLKGFTRLPVGFTGSVGSVALADSIIESGDADFIGFARALLADNALINKENAGDHHLVHHCLWDAHCFRDKREPQADRVYCCVNPQYPRPEFLQRLYEEMP